MTMHNDDRSVVSSLLTGIWIGAVAGAVAGILLAPKSGTETRDSITASIESLKQTVGEYLAKVGEEVPRKMHEAVDLVKQTGTDLKEKGGEIVDAVKTKSGEIVDAMTTKTAEVADAAKARSAQFTSNTTSPLHDM